MLTENSFKEVLNFFNKIWHVYESFGIRDLCMPYIHS